MLEVNGVKEARNKKEKTRWKESRLALKALDTEQVERNSNYAIQVMVGWLEAVHLVSDMAAEIRQMHKKKGITLESLRKKQLKAHDSIGGHPSESSPSPPTKVLRRGSISTVAAAATS